MIKIRNEAHIQKLRESGRIAAAALALGGELSKPGATLISIDTAIRNFIESHGAKPSFLHYNGFPASACISVNEEVIHGIPDMRRLKEGDIVSIDVGAYYHGFHGDCANTFAVGEVSDEAKRLIETTRNSFFKGFEKIVEGNRIGDIGFAVQTEAESAGFSVVREYVGHGVGENLHESPDVPNYGRPGRGPRLMNGMVIAVEPMICEKSAEIRVLDNDWTVVTVDKGLAAHYENTVAVTANGPMILTDPN